MPANPGPASLSRDQLLILGDTSEAPAGKIETFQPVADYLAARLGDFGIEEGRVVIGPDMPTMIDHIKTGRVDLFFDSPFPAFTMYRYAGARPLLRRWKKGVAEYHAVLVSHKNTGIAEPAGLLGQMIAFDDAVSTSGYFLPKGYLMALGYNLVEKPSASSVLVADEIGYVFSGGEENVVAWILEGRTAAAIPSGDLKDLEPDVKSQLVILGKTVPVPRHIALARPEMDAGLHDRVVELLLGMHETAEGQSVLGKFERTKKFDELPLGADGTMTMLRELFGPK